MVKLDYGKVSASDISSFDIALWYKKLHKSLSLLGARFSFEYSLKSYSVL